MTFRTELAVFSFLLSLAACSSGIADEFTVLTPTGQETFEARLLGSGQAAMAFEMPDGQLKIVAAANVRDRVIKAGPEPITTAEMAKQLEERFGAEKFRFQISGPYVVGLVLGGPLPRGSESRVRGLLKKAGGFMQNVETTFERFQKKMRIGLAEPRYPLVLLIFESDIDFESYAVETTGNRGLSAGNIAGFYSHNTNWLAVRLGECATFEVPLHEAIHQQVYNREIFQRLAPVPAWFNEGIATGFEGNGERVNTGPEKVNSGYAKKAATQTGRINWETVIRDDAAFRGDVLAGEAYIHAWSLHWMLVTEYPDEYVKYVSILSQKKTLALSTEDERAEDFRKAFGAAVGDIQEKFPTALKFAIKRQRISLVDKNASRPGYSFTQQQLGEVGITAVNNRGTLTAGGVLKNASPIRPMDFYVCLVTTGGQYCEWLHPAVPIGRTMKLGQQPVTKVIPGALGLPTGSFRVMVRSCVPGTEESSRWAQGSVPRPTAN